jgi:hypothetical protein
VGKECSRTERRKILEPGICGDKHQLEKSCLPADLDHTNDPSKEPGLHVYR